MASRFVAGNAPEMWYRLLGLLAWVAFKINEQEVLATCVAAIYLGDQLRPVFRKWTPPVSERPTSNRITDFGEWFLALGFPAWLVCISVHQTTIADVIVLTSLSCYVVMAFWGGQKDRHNP